MACNIPVPFHSHLINEWHLSLNNQVMINVQNANIIYEDRCSWKKRCEVTLHHLIRWYSHRVDRWEFWLTWISSHSHFHCHVYSSNSLSHFWHTCVALPMGFPRRNSHGKVESHSNASLYYTAAAQTDFDIVRWLTEDEAELLPVT